MSQRECGEGGVSVEGSVESVEGVKKEYYSLRQGLM